MELFIDGLIGEAEQLKVTAATAIIKGQVVVETNIIHAAYTESAIGSEYIGITKHSRMVGDKADVNEIFNIGDIAYWKSVTGGLTKVTSGGNRKVGWFKEASPVGATQAVISFDGTKVVGN